ncbi:TlpA disulfide reductase family protein [uncultured Ramlibacter sp.]|mgnify:FL=1|uniref:TlpA family protein disulfide reductase n=1 Tax=uncultured Ramlibacter sp. TaxID=260755 RepID=UPI0026208AC6|nr:TlpA disulfide reductase family protein [uncultured Ramlibacter sp.]
MTASPFRLFQLAQCLLGLALLLAGGWPAQAASVAAAGPRGLATPALALADAQGKTWSLADARGKVVIVNFWASWCEPCRAEMPSLQSLADLYGNELVVLAVNFKERDARALQFAQAAGLSLPMPMDRDGAVAARWGVKVFPSSFIIGRDGQVRWRVSGEVDWTGREAARWIEPLLK